MSTASPEGSQDAHLYSDVDMGEDSLHHTLGTSHNQAARGDHKHGSGGGYKAGKLTANVLIGTGTTAAGGQLTTVMTTDDLDVGTWLVHFTMGYFVSNSTSIVTLNAVLGTAQGELIGGNTSAEDGRYQYAPARSTHLNFIADVTTAGTIIFKARATLNTGSAMVAGSSDPGDSPNTTGYTAIKIG